MNPIQQALEALRPFAEKNDEALKVTFQIGGASRVALSVRPEELIAARTAYEALSKYQDGWVLVPREPTEEMLLAAFKQAEENLFNAHSDNTHCKTNEERSAWSIKPIYKTMLASARQHMEGE